MVRIGSAALRLDAIRAEDASMFEPGVRRAVLEEALTDMATEAELLVALGDGSEVGERCLAWLEDAGNKAAWERFASVLIRALAAATNAADVAALFLLYRIRDRDFRGLRRRLRSRGQ